MLIDEHGLSQKKVASILGISEGAVSQYLNSKRGAGVKFDSKAMKMVKESAGRIALDNSVAMQELMMLSSADPVKRTICELHLEQDTSVVKGCDICFRN